MKKKSIVAGNWKMNKTPYEGKAFMRDVKDMVKNTNSTEIIFFPAFTFSFKILSASSLFILIFPI